MTAAVKCRKRLPMVKVVDHMACCPSCGFNGFSGGDLRRIPLVGIVWQRPVTCQSCGTRCRLRSPW